MIDWVKTAYLDFSHGFRFRVRDNRMTFRNGGSWIEMNFQYCRVRKYLTDVK
jgi:hypothetical protein